MEVFDDRVQGFHIVKSHLDWRHSWVHRSGSAISHQFRLGLYRIQCADDARHIEVSLGITTSLKFFLESTDFFTIDCEFHLMELNSGKLRICYKIYETKNRGNRSLDKNML